MSVDTQTAEREKATKEVIYNTSKYWQETHQGYGFENVTLDSTVTDGSRPDERTQETDDMRNCCKECDPIKGTKKWVRDFTLLFIRTSLEIYRNYGSLLVRVATSMFFAVILSLVYNLKKSQADIQNRLGLLFFVTINQSFGPVVVRFFHHLFSLPLPLPLSHTQPGHSPPALATLPHLAYHVTFHSTLSLFATLLVFIFVYRLMT